MVCLQRSACRLTIAVMVSFINLRVNVILCSFGAVLVGGAFSQITFIGDRCGDN